MMHVMDSSSRLAQRITNLKSSATLALTAKVKALNAAGADVIGFAAGEPDFDTPEHIKQAAIDALNAGQTHYMPVPGDPAARQAIADKLRNDNAINCSADDIVITTGGKHAIYLALQCLVDADRGAQVLVPTPGWLSYRPMIELAGGEVVEIPGSVDNDFKITAQQLQDAITDRSVAIIINSPSNPCGTMYSPDELRELATVIERHPQLTVISDEIYEKLIFGGVDHFSIGSVQAIADRVITINGLSKAYAMTGWRIGYACAPGNDSDMARAIAKLQGQMTSHITSFCYAPIVEALTNAADDVERMRQEFAGRAVIIHERLTAMPGIRCPKPTGAFYVFPDISATFGKRSGGGRLIDSAMSFAEALLEEANVAVVPGDDFGGCGANHVRLSFACSAQQIEEGCRRIHRWIEALT
ncbi:MAG: pyridoxal phosphate-dependent aminotransferase [Planctomycetes bacterium]|nr:pyridoxal phosphate-dependent aminotransferase [Planctomycetota bacterium]